MSERLPDGGCSDFEPLPSDLFEGGFIDFRIDQIRTDRDVDYFEDLLEVLCVALEVIGECCD